MEYFSIWLTSYLADLWLTKSLLWGLIVARKLFGKAVSILSYITKQRIIVAKKPHKKCTIHKHVIFDIFGSSEQESGVTIRLPRYYFFITSKTLKKLLLFFKAIGGTATLTTDSGISGADPEFPKGRRDQWFNSFPKKKNKKKTGGFNGD